MLINNRDAVYGVVKQSDPKYYYTGENSDTAIVTVENNEKLIKVDVKTEALLGETSTKAYPGHLGKQNQENIRNVSERLTETEQDLAESIANLKSQMKESDAVINSKIDNTVLNFNTFSIQIDSRLDETNSQINYIKNDINSLESDIGEIAADMKDAQQKIYSIQTDLNNLDNDVETVVKQNIGSIETALGEESNRAINAEKILEQSISDLRASTNTLASALDTETARAESAEEELGTRIDTVSSDILAEKERATTEENKLHESIVTINNRLDDGKTSVYAAIEAAEARAKAYADEQDADTIYDDTALTNRVSVIEAALEDKVDTNEYTVKMSELDNAITETLPNRIDEAKTTLLGQESDDQDKDTIHGAKAYADYVGENTAADVKAELIGTETDTYESNTIRGSKLYSDKVLATEVSNRTDADDAIRTRIIALENTITALEGTTHFIGVQNELPASANNGDICIVGTKEYVYDTASAAEVKWVELGDTTAEASRLTAVESEITTIKNTSTAAATQISNQFISVNADITRIEQLIDSLHPLAFVEGPKVTTDGFKALNPLDTVYDTLTVEWKFNKKLTTDDILVVGNKNFGITIAEGTQKYLITSGDGEQITTTDGISCQYTWTNVHENTSETTVTKSLTVQARRIKNGVTTQETETKSVSTTFTNYVLYGAFGEDKFTGITDLTGAGFKDKLSTNNNITVTVDVSNTNGTDKYFYFACPNLYVKTDASNNITSPIFTVNGFSGGVSKVREDCTYTYGTDTVVYYTLFKSVQKNLGNTTFNIS